MESQVIGKVVAVTGEVVLEHNGDSIPMEVGSPVYEGGVLKTGDDSHIEVRFTDDTMLSQGANSEVSIDDYVFDQPDSASSILLNLTEGTLRNLTGKIADENPESFEVKSPLATLGIRGTDFRVFHQPDSGTKVILNQISENHILIVSDQFANIRYQNDPGTFVSVKPDEPISIVEVLSDEERKNVLELTPFTTLPNNGVSEEGEDPPDGSALDTGAAADGQDGSQNDQGETDSSETDSTNEPGASTSSGGSTTKTAMSTGNTVPGAEATSSEIDVSPLPEGLADLETDQSFDISMLDNLPPTGAGPAPSETQVELFSPTLYDPFESNLNPTDPFNQINFTTFQAASTLYEPASSIQETYEPSSGLSEPIQQQPANQPTSVESTPESDAFLVSAAPEPPPPSLPPDPGGSPSQNEPPPGTSPPVLGQTAQSPPPTPPTSPSEPPPD
ncbi:MAG: FecR family protein, partial [Desulfofustis sp.]|nr:FecR family protein [Desulfofustis sp.]